MEFENNIKLHNLKLHTNYIRKFHALKRVMKSVIHVVDVTNMTNMLLVACRSLRCHENRGEACNSWHSARDAFAKVASGRGRGEGGTEGPGGVQLFTSAERKCTRFNPSHPLTIDHHFTVNCVVCPISSLFQVLSVQ